MSKKNIYITGFMASGKSTIGRNIARKLSRKFIDTDKLIEANEKTSIKNIFNTHGEEHFRQLETNLIASFQDKFHLVVSLGGGAILSDKNRAVFKQGHWFFLNTDLEIIKERLLRTNHRPLAQNGFEQIEKLYKERFSLYNEASHIIDTNHQNIEFICHEILQRIITHENSAR